MRVWAELHDGCRASTANHAVGPGEGAAVVLERTVAAVVFRRDLGILLLHGHWVQGGAAVDGGQGRAVARHVHNVLVVMARHGSTRCTV